MREKLDLDTTIGVAACRAAGALMAELLATDGRRSKVILLWYGCKDSKKISTPTTLCIDVGGTGLKIMLLDAQGKSLTDSPAHAHAGRNRHPTRMLAELG